MGCFKIYRESCAGVTAVSNLFIDSYMKEANDAQLKIYLYLLRMTEAGLTTSISDMADQFNYTEKDVLRALKYWEKNRLISLEYETALGEDASREGGRSLSGIRLLEVPGKSQGEPNTPVVSFVHLPAKAETVFDKPELTVPSYSLDKLKEFKEKEETSQLLFVAEQYIGRPLSPREINTILFFSDRLGFSEDLIDYLIQYCVDKGKKDFRYIEKVAISWAQEGITTPKQAARLAGKYDKIVYTVMKALGKSGTPTKAEAGFALKWAKEYGFTQDIILEACNRTVMATDKHRFEYAERILKSWHGAQVRHKADILALDDAYAKTKASRPSGHSPTGTNSSAAGSFNQFLHTDYDFDALEKEILSN
ncbi:MAG: DnaD domain protein [Lachnospiraceae bacterium]|jgi:DnaD/phage-associated family protein|nr:DnaD domain protein [Lachnospiraceae bacterium]